MNHELTIGVEVSVHKAELEMFCRQHGQLLQKNIIVCKHLERR